MLMLLSFRAKRGSRALYSAKDHKIPREGAEAGFSLIEVLVVSGILIVVLSSLFTTLEVAQRQQRRTEAIVDNQLQTTNAMQVLTREIRGANPIDVSGITDPLEMRTSITVVTGSNSSNETKTWRYYLDPTTRALLQEQIGAGGPVVLLPRVVNGADQPLFRYFDQFQEELTPGVLSPSVIASCTTKVVIDIVSRPEVAGAPDYEAITEVELRNKLPGGTGCQNF